MVDIGNGNKGDRFVCPSDRQLALRAKLKTGWSIKTGSLGQPHPPVSEPLSNSETEAILNVVKRAEQEERKEAERVGKLVDRLENMRRMALGKSPTECLLCGETFGMLSGGPRMICVDCRKMVCNKCGVETSSSKSREIWLCKICSETREMWKKSGAWFFRGIPQYVLPPNSKLLTGESTSTSKSPKVSPHLTKQQEDSGGGASDSDDDIKKFYTAPKASKKEDVRVITKSPVDEIHQPHYGFRLQHKNNEKTSVTFIDSPQYLGSSCDISDQLGMGSVTPSLSLSPHDKPMSILTRRDSYISPSGRNDKSFESGIDDKSSGSGSSVTSSISQGCPDTSNTRMGVIELTIHYDQFSNVLHCTVHRAKGLQAMDINGHADPFCKLNILPTNNPSTRLRTKTVHKTKNPEFNETVTFYGITDSDILKKSLHVLVLDDDKYGYDFMGEAKIALMPLRNQNSIKVSAALYGPSPAGDYAPDNEHICTLWGDVPNIRGQILLSLMYNTKRRALIVLIQRCSHLPPMDSNGYSDPFVKLYISPDSHHNKKHKTSIKWKTLNPVFNEEFVFEARPNELTSQCIKLTVWDKDYGKSNDYLGGLIIGYMSKGKRLKHWLDVIRFPDHRHEAWHYLTEDMVE